MNENFTTSPLLKVVDQIPLPYEICRINADGTTTYHWDRIEAAAQRWEPGCADIAVCLAKLLLPLRRREWVSLTEEEIIRLVHGVLEKPINYCEPAAWQLAGGITRAVEQALKERNR
jgi:hypothetical protein